MAEIKTSPVLPHTATTVDVSNGTSKIQRDAPSVLAARAVLEQLLRENRAFARAEEPTMPPSTPTLRLSLARNGQTPGAVVVACSDSRVPPEIFFRAQVGDVFVIRTAGNVADDVSTVASIEYALLNLKSKLLLILGHEKCGAVTAGLSYKENPETGDSLTPALRKHVANIADRIDTTDIQHLDKDHKLSAAVANHTVKVAESIRKASETIRKLEETGEILITPAVYDLASGLVSVIRS